MRRHASLVFLLAVGFAGSGCYTVRYTTKMVPDGNVVSAWNHFFMWGLVGDPVIDVPAMCPNGFAHAEVTHSFVNQLVSFITLGIYSPTTVDIACAHPPANPFAAPPDAPPPPPVPPEGTPMPGVSP